MPNIQSKLIYSVPLRFVIKIGSATQVPIYIELFFAYIKLAYSDFHLYQGNSLHLKKSNIWA